MGRTREVLGEKGRRIRELTALVQKRFGFPETLEMKETEGEGFGEGSRNVMEHLHRRGGR